MEVIDFITDKISCMTILSWFLSIFGCIQLGYSIRNFAAQRHFFKNNDTKEKISSTPDGTLLKYTLDILDTMESQKMASFISIIATIVFCGGIVLLSECVINTVSQILAFVAFVVWLVASRYNNRIVKQIRAAKLSLSDDKEL